MTVRGAAKTASAQLCVRFPRGEGETLRGLIIREVERRANELAEAYRGQFRSAARYSAQALADMTLSRAAEIYLEDAAATWKRGNMRKTCVQNVRHLAANLPDIQLRALTKKALLGALPEKAGARTKEKYLKNFVLFLSYAEDRQGISSGLLPMVEACIEGLRREGKPQQSRAKTLRAGNASELSDAAEKQINDIILRNYNVPSYVAAAYLKGTGLNAPEICTLKVGNLICSESDAEAVFLRLRREYISATQDYTFPIFPWEARLTNLYLDTLRDASGGLDPERWLFCAEDGQTPLDPAKVNDLCRALLMDLMIGYADQVGNYDIRRDKGPAMLRSTYRYRLQHLCGLTADNDEGAFLFMMHMSLSKRVQADHYRSFSGESGRQCLLDYVKRDRRFIPPDAHRKATSVRMIDGREVVTMWWTDNELPQQLELELELNEGDTVDISSDGGGMIYIEPLDTRTQPG